MEFSLWVGDMSFFVFCKFEIVIFRIVQVMAENVLCVFLCTEYIFLINRIKSLLHPAKLFLT